MQPRKIPDDVARIAERDAVAAHQSGDEENALEAAEIRGAGGAVSGRERREAARKLLRDKWGYNFPADDPLAPPPQLVDAVERFPHLDPQLVAAFEMTADLAALRPENGAETWTDEKGETWARAERDGYVLIGSVSDPEDRAAKDPEK